MRPKRRFGQNFLTGSHYPSRIVAALAPRPGEALLEIGPGEGALTRLLLDAGATLTAIEIDPDLIPLLEQRFGANSDLRLLRADILALDPRPLYPPGQPVRVVANLPYYISTAVLQHLLTYRQLFGEMVLMLQREVVDRIIAPPGSRTYGYLSVLVQLFCQVEALFDVPPGAFRPIPKVHSTVLRLRIRTEPAVPIADPQSFLLLCQVLFSQRRKTLANNLRAGWTRLGLSTEAGGVLTASLPTIGIDGQRRAETLSLSELAALHGAVLREASQTIPESDSAPSPDQPT